MNSVWIKGASALCIDTAAGEPLELDERLVMEHDAVEFIKAQTCRVQAMADRFPGADEIPALFRRDGGYRLTG